MNTLRTSMILVVALMTAAMPLVPMASAAPPDKTSNPSPGDGTTVSSTTVTLTWTGGHPDGLAVDYYVYMDTQPNFTPDWGEKKKCGPIQTTSCTVSGLSNGVTYYWRVDAADGITATPGDYWSFTVSTAPCTGTAPCKTSNPSPQHGATGQPTTLTLTWSGGHPQGLAVDYYVYMDTQPNFVPDWGAKKKCGPILTTSCTVSGLAAGTKYYWRVDAADGITATPGDYWEFTTESGPINSCTGGPAGFQPTAGGSGASQPPMGLSSAPLALPGIGGALKPYVGEVLPFRHDGYTNLVLLVFEKEAGAASHSYAWDGSGTLANVAERVVAVEGFSVRGVDAQGRPVAFEGLPARVLDKLTPAIGVRVPTGALAEFDVAFTLVLADGTRVASDDVALTISAISATPMPTDVTHVLGKGGSQPSASFGSKGSAYWCGSQDFTSQVLMDGCGTATASATGDIRTEVSTGYSCSAGSGQGKVFADSWATVLDANAVFHVGLRIEGEWQVRTQLSTFGIRDGQAKLDLILREQATDGTVQEYVAIIHNCVSTDCDSGLQDSATWNWQFTATANYQYSPYLWGRVLATSCQGDICRAWGTSAYAKSYELHATWMRITAD